MTAPFHVRVVVVLLAAKTVPAHVERLTFSHLSGRAKHVLITRVCRDQGRGNHFFPPVLHRGQPSVGYEATHMNVRI